MCVSVRKIEAFWLRKIQLDCCYLPVPAKRVFGYKIKFWAIKGRIAQAFMYILAAFLVYSFLKLSFGTFP